MKPVVSFVVFAFIAGVLRSESISAASASDASVASARDHLIQDLLHDYHSSVEPAGQVDLKFGLAILCFRFDKTSRELKTSAWEKYIWSDYRLSWNPKDYNGIRRMRVPSNLIWKPDIDCYNAIETETRSSENVLIEHDGVVTWVPRAQYKTLCSVEGDKPVCDLSFGSWTYDQWTVALDMEGQGVETTSYLNGTCPWLLESFTASAKSIIYPCCPEPFGSLEITVNLQSNQLPEK